jgi:polyisoprenoid-binding protein YceI
MTLKAEADALAGVLRAKRALDGRARRGASAVADPTAREFLRRADPILRRLIARAPTFSRDQSTIQRRQQAMSTVDTQVLPTGTWQVDKVHSSIGFAVDYMAGTFHGTFGDFDAAVTDGVLNASAKVASVQVKVENLAAHLQGPDFFDAEAYPELTFTSNAINRDGDRVTVDGEITIKGHSETAEITGEISDPIADSYGGERFGLTLQTVVDRDTFGVSWNNPLPSGEPALSNEVTIVADLQLSKQA